MNSIAAARRLERQSLLIRTERYQKMQKIIRSPHHLEIKVVHHRPVFQYEENPSKFLEVNDEVC